MNRRKFLKSVVPLCITLYDGEIAQNLFPTLEEVKKNKNPKLRQSYIDKIVNELYEEDEQHKTYIHSVEYSLTGKEPIYTPVNPNRVGLHQEQKIIISSEFFEDKNLINDDDVKSALGDHDFFHARDAFYGIDLLEIKVDYSIMKHITTEFFKTVFEIRAYQNQLSKLVYNKRKPNEKINLNNIYQYWEEFQKLKEFSKKNDLEGKIAKALVNSLYIIPKRKNDMVELEVTRRQK